MKNKKKLASSSALINVSLSDNAYRNPIDPRRMPEVADSRMIREDHSAMSNLPQESINRLFNPGRYMPHYWMESEI
jgi:hypothetical protein